MGLMMGPVLGKQSTIQGEDSEILFVNRLKYIQMDFQDLILYNNVICYHIISVVSTQNQEKYL